MRYCNGGDPIMSDIDEKKSSGKAGKRKKHADQRNRKSDQKQPPKAEMQRSATAPIAPVVTASTGTAPSLSKAAKIQPGPQPGPIIAAVESVPVALQSNELHTDTAILAAETIAVAAQDARGPSAVATAPTIAPVAAPDVSESPAAPAPSIDTAPVARPKVWEQAVASPPLQTSAEAAPVLAADASVSLQTIANAYGEYTRKSLEQTKCFFDKLTAVRSLEQAVEIQTEFAKQACETFVAEAQRIHDLHRELARQRFERLEGLMTMGAQASC
jgi:Phasin protein